MRVFAVLILVVTAVATCAAQGNDEADVSYDRFTDTTVVRTRTLMFTVGVGPEEHAVRIVSGYKHRGEAPAVPKAVFVEINSRGVYPFYRLCHTLDLIVGSARFPNVKAKYKRIDRDKYDVLEGLVMELTPAQFKTLATAQRVDWRLCVDEVTVWQADLATFRSAGERIPGWEEIEPQPLPLMKKSR